MTSMTFITLICLAFVGAATAGKDWSYDDLTKWPNANTSCGKTSQSPINILPDKAIYKAFEEFDFTSYNILDSINLTNNGHTVQAAFDGSKPTIKGGGLSGKFEALQLHLHWSANKTDEGSEHALNNTFYPLEMHIVHRSSKITDMKTALKTPESLAVLGFFFKVGTEENKELKEVLSNADTVTSLGKNINRFNLMALISKSISKRFYRYSGSLTTPPCSEVVTWTIYEEPLMISKEQHKKLMNAKNSHGKTFKNYRPVQSMNDRKVYTNMKIKNASGMSKAFSVLIVFSVFVSYLS